MIEWRPIPGFEGFYEVSDDGQVRSLDRVIDKGVYGKVAFLGRVLKSRVGRAGYRTVALSRNGVQSYYSVHRLVAQAFLPDTQFDGAFVLHGDGNRENNSPSNLRWGTASENIQDAVRQLTHTNAAKSRCPQGHPYNKANTAVHMIKGRGPQRICRTCKRKADRVYGRRRRGTGLVKLAEIRELSQRLADAETARDTANARASL